MKIPPADPSAGVKTQSLFLVPHTEAKQFLSMDAFLFLETLKYQIWSSQYFLRCFWRNTSNLLTFRERIFIKNLGWIPAESAIIPKSAPMHFPSSFLPFFLCLALRGNYGHHSCPPSYCWLGIL